MTIKEAILKSLDDLKKPVSHKDIFKHIKEKNYYYFKNAKTPESTISALLGDFIRKGDTRVKRTKIEKGGFLYYLSKYESELNLNNNNFKSKNNYKDNKIVTFKERDLHLLLSSYLKSKNIYSKTIFHEQSTKNQKNQKWNHPDMIGIEFLSLKNKIAKNFLKLLNKTEIFKIISYELKKEINTDYELKEAYFQAVSNSSWANYGYLVAFEINDDLIDEMERLNQSFGIGVIKLNSNPYTSKILFQSKLKQLDFKTIDKLCEINDGFSKFIEYIEKILSAGDKYYKSVEREFEKEICDKFFKSDSEIEKYCKDKNIPIEKSEFLEELDME